MKNIILKAEMLSKTYSTGGIQQNVLKNLNIDIYEKDFTIIMGSSGSGKSTLLYALSGMDKITLGKIYYGNEEISEYNNNQLAELRRDNCGFVFQQIHLNDTMSILDNILISGLLVNKDKKAVIKRAKELLELVGIGEDKYNKFPSQLSGGEEQRVGIVRALINKPRIIFADEPTGALNSNSAKEVLDILCESNKNGQSIVMVTHDIKTALRADRILYLKDGVILSELSLGKYNEKNYNERIKNLQSFLDEMGW